MSGILTYKCSFGPIKVETIIGENQDQPHQHIQIYFHYNGLVVQSGYHGCMVYCGIGG